MISSLLAVKEDTSIIGLLQVVVFFLNKNKKVLEKTINQIKLNRVLTYSLPFFRLFLF